jgi:hypothetical protein
MKQTRLLNRFLECGGKSHVIAITELNGEFAWLKGDLKVVACTSLTMLR